MPTDNDEKKEMSSTFDKIKDDPKDESPEAKAEKDAQDSARAVTLGPFQSTLGTKLDDEWQKTEGEKIFSERRMIRDLRQYRGQYDPEIVKQIHPNRSKAFIRLTRTKVKTFDATGSDYFVTAELAHKQIAQSCSGFVGLRAICCRLWKERNQHRPSEICVNT